MSEPVSFPQGAWDTHFHAWGEEGDAEAALAEARELHRGLGIDRAVLVQAGHPPADQGPLLRLLARHPDLRAVAKIDDAQDDAVLDALAAAGVRGVRFQFVSFLPKPATPETLRRGVERAAQRGWHVLLHVELTDLPPLADAIARMTVPVIVDHCAHSRPSALHDRAFDLLLQLHRLPHCWVKLSSMDRWSKVGAPTYEDMVPLGRAVLANAPERVLWATDWPHVMYRDPRAPGDPPPDPRHLARLLHRMVDGDEALLRQVLVDNPSRLYA
ncbi:amidohydrolase family protein [Ramlibacter sp.]|uniref:amidohydrolase family protein n=1 Tax=Ramlibacter sp. TaxID=1917967 RepID=UPI003D0CFB03